MKASSSSLSQVRVPSFLPDKRSFVTCRHFFRHGLERSRTTAKFSDVEECHVSVPCPVTLHTHLPPSSLSSISHPSVTTHFGVIKVPFSRERSHPTQSDTSKPRHMILLRTSSLARADDKHGVRRNTIEYFPHCVQPTTTYDLMKQKRSVIASYWSFLLTNSSLFLATACSISCDRLNIRPSLPPTSPCQHKATNTQATKHPQISANGVGLGNDKSRVQSFSMGNCTMHGMTFISSHSHVQSTSSTHRFQQTANSHQAQVHIS